LEGIEKVSELRGDALRSAARSGSVGRLIDTFAEGRLCLLKALLRGGVLRCQSKFAGHLIIEQGVAKLLNAYRLEAHALGSRRRLNRAAISEKHALPRIARIVDVREITAGRLNAL
jgi:hypothetical protein